MEYQNKIELAKANMRQAEAALETYMRSGTYDPEQYKQLTYAVKVSRDEYLGQLGIPFPRTWFDSI